MSDLKQVKVDNWGIYFLQRLKHFFNRTDYCDLTLQFQDNAQLKVHRLVLSACTEYFELLERTCEMYEDCLVMPDDLQADVVVPIVNFMYTGQLEFRPELLDRLHQTSQIMNMPVLTKLLDAQKQILPTPPPKPLIRYGKKVKSIDAINPPRPSPSVATPSVFSNKRSFTKAFESTRDKSTYQPPAKTERSFVTKQNNYTPTKPKQSYERKPAKKPEPRPTRYDLPEDLDQDGLFDSFTNISYTSHPLVIHPEATKHYSKKSNPSLFSDISESGGYKKPVVDIVECRKISRDDMYCDDDDMDDAGSHLTAMSSYKNKGKDNLFDKMVQETNTTRNKPKVVIEKESNQNIDHAKIISEVLKKYPHLTKGNKNIKLKILNSPTYKSPGQIKSKKQITLPNPVQKQKTEIKVENPDFTYESDVLDTREAVKLISLGAENIKGPWICLICGTPGKALHFSSYYKFRRHLVEVHKEKIITNMCEYCGLVSNKRNHMLHHMYCKHGIEPPPAYNFPKCEYCDYIALTDGFLVKHKLTHYYEAKKYSCHVCSAQFNDSQELRTHIKDYGHSYCPDRKTNFKCIYCQKPFLREKCLYSHLRTHHNDSAVRDGVIDNSFEEKGIKEMVRRTFGVQTSSNQVIKVEYEPQTETSAMDIDSEGEGEIENQYEIEQRPDGNIQVVSKKVLSVNTPKTQKILNPGFKNKSKSIQEVPRMHHEIVEPRADSPKTIVSTSEEIVVIDNQEYIVTGDKLIPKKTINIFKHIDQSNDEYILSDKIYEEENPTNSANYSVMQNPNVAHEANQPIQYVVSSEEQYKTLAAEHPIIFDEDNTNKTLTVLTNPHNNVMNTATVDITNTQPGEMMILQQNYSLNVSEAISAENSNIVVVYSHAVSDGSKPYQIISTQDLGAQFVQPSCALTETYETITSTQIATVQPSDGWTNNDQQVIGNSHEVLSEQPLQGNSQLNLEESMSEINTGQDESQQLNIVDNPQPEVLTANQIVSESAELQVAQTQFEVVIEDGTQADIQLPDEVESQPESVPDTIIIENVNEVQGSIESECTEQVASECQEQVTSESQKAQSEYTHPPSEVGCEQTVDEPYPNELVGVSTNTEESTDENSEQLMEPTNKITEQHANEITNEEIEVSASKTNAVEKNLSDNPVVKKKIQNLTMEWSEDEDDGTTENDQTEVSEPDPVCAQPSDLEESVETIQQEINNQVEGKDIQTAEDVNDDQEPLEQSSQAETSQTDPEVNGVKEVPQEKISSLLNDWEDNEDSQEDVEEQNDQNNGHESTGVEKDDSQIPVNEKKAANVKKLVSDWDEDEEEEEVKE